MSSDKTNINVFIDSVKNIDKSGKPYNWNVNIPTNLINCNNDEGLRLNIVYFHMLNSMNNVNITNCNFTIVYTDAGGIVQNSTNYIIQNGIYDVYTFRDYINTLCNGILSISYNKVSNSYTFKKTYTGAYAKVNLSVINCGVFFGISNGSILELSSTGYTGSFVNMVGYTKIAIIAKGVQFEDPTIDNLGGDGFEESEFLFWISRQDKAPFSVLRYEDDDNGDAYNYKLHNKNVSLVNLQLVDENLNPIYDAPHYQMILQFEKYQRDSQESLKVLTIISNYMKQIYTVLLMLLEGLKII